jgi:hypothetical protein
VILSQAFDAVEGGDFVALGQGGIVEGVVSEKYHLVIKGHDCLTNMNQFPGKTWPGHLYPPADVPEWAFLLPYIPYFRPVLVIPGATL